VGLGDASVFLLLLLLQVTLTHILVDSLNKNHWFSKKKKKKKKKRKKKKRKLKGKVVGENQSQFCTMSSCWKEEQIKGFHHSGPAVGLHLNRQKRMSLA
jgi:hypothetical protein